MSRLKAKYKYLLNFSASHTGGGYKRLYEYARWFNDHGGACFIIHSSCESIKNEFINNSYFLVSQRRYQRVFNDCSYLPGIIKKIGMPDLYYSYGIPIYYRLGKVNWFHLSNILPLHSKGIPISFFDKNIKFNLLKWKMKSNFINADVISAESNFSLTFINSEESEKLFLSGNGSDNELHFLAGNSVIKKDNIATVVGTQTYKVLLDSYEVFKTLRNENKKLKLVLIGDKSAIPRELLTNKNVVATGVIPQKDVIEYLKITKYYISTTCIENSSNATTEGVVFADESYISNIAPHRELLLNETHELVDFPGLSDKIFHIKREGFSGKNIHSWDEVIKKMNNKVALLNL